MFRLNCIFGIDAAAVQQSVSRSVLKYGVSAEAMAAHKFFFKSNLHCTPFIKLAAVPKHMVASGEVRPRVLALGQHRYEETSQRWRAVGYTVSDLTGLEIEPQIAICHHSVLTTVANKMSLNISKTNYIVFRTLNSKLPRNLPSLKLRNRLII